VVHLLKKQQCGDRKPRSWRLVRPSPETVDRDVAAGQRLDRTALYTSKQLGEPRIARQIRPDDLGREQRTDHLFELAAITGRDHRRNSNIERARAARQEQLESGQHGGEPADAMPPGGFAQLPIDRLSDTAPLAPKAEAGGSAAPAA